MAGRELGTVGEEVERLQFGKRLLGDANHVELAVGLEGAHVGGEVELVGHVGAVEDEVKLELVLVGPAVLGRDDDLLGAQALRVVDLVGRVREGVRLGAEGLAPLQAQMAQTADATDGDGLARADVGADERGVGCDAGAEEGRGLVRGDLVGDLEGEVLVGADVGCPAAVGGAAVGVVCVVRVDHVRAVVLVLVLAHVALEARPHLGADADPVAYFDAALDVLADLHGLADHLVADAERALEVTPAAGACVHVAAADAAALDLDVDVAVLEGLGIELLLVELVPCLGRVDAKALEGVGVSHVGGCVCFWCKWWL